MKSKKIREKKIILDEKTLADEKPNKNNKIPFVSWFFKQVRAGKLGLWQEREIILFFIHHDLHPIEDEEEKYDNILKLY